jgi:molybdopterin-guanine dinucleotide biosynthesis protein A
LKEAKLNACAIILSGGKGSRVGYQEKGLLKFQGEYLIKRKIDSLKQSFRQIIIVTNKEELYKKFADKIIKIIPDLYPYEGPLQAILTGLKQSSFKVNFVCGVDMPFTKLELVHYMFSLAKDFEIVVPKINDRIEPLCAFYSQNVLKNIGALKNTVAKKIIVLIKDNKTKFIEEKEIVRYDPELQSFVNLNTNKSFLELA